MSGKRDQLMLWCRTLVWSGLVYLTLLSLHAQRRIASESATTVPGSRLRLNLVRDPGRGQFLAVFRNDGDEALVLNLGRMLGNGSKQYPDRLHFLLKDASGNVLHLDLIFAGIIAGRLDAMVVPLPAGGSYVLRIDLKNYFSPREKIWELNPAPGMYTLTAEYTGADVPQRAANTDMQGISLMPYWLGTIRSKSIKFTLPRGLGVVLGENSAR